MSLERQVTLTSQTINYSNIELLSRENILQIAESVIDYYRTNPHYFAKDYLHIDTRDFQDILISMMNEAQTSTICASRGLGKTFIVAVFATIRAILYPGSQIIIASYRRGQSINVLNKILQEIRPNSPELNAEIKRELINGTNAIIEFKNSSFIKVVTAGESARSNRATLLIVDEYVQVKKTIIDDILKKFLTLQRMPVYSELSREDRFKEYSKEISKSIYLSSATFKDSWGFQKFKDTFDSMLASGKQFACALPYELSIYEGLLNPKTIEEEMLESDFSQMRFDMEYECIWYGGGEDTFFNYNTISKTRNIKYPMLPEEIGSKLNNNAAIKIPIKKNGERRILSADIGLMASGKHKNDATAIFINQMTLGRGNRCVSNIVYTTTCEGLRTDEQALIIRKLYDEYQCDYIVLDTSGIGLGVYDSLAQDIVDDETGEIYPALSCCNNADMASRCAVPDAEKTIWAIKASAQFNSDCAFLLREAFRSGRIRLLTPEYEAEELLGLLKGYDSLSAEDKVSIQLPYIHTTLLVDELIKLQYGEAGGKVRLYEKTGMRKDRYSSLSYNYSVATQIENKINKKAYRNINEEDMFIIKAPQIRMTSSRKGLI